MKQNAENGRVALLETFASVGQQFDQVRRQISGRETAINRAMRQVRAACEAGLPGVAELPEDHAVRQLASGLQAKLAGLTSDWIADAESYERHTQFHARFGDSLLVYVYGKVKAGKSSLGNHIAYGHSMPDMAVIEQAQPGPTFFWEAGNGSTESMDHATMRRQRCFGVGQTETTSSIQGFALPGLTWVDSPGLHSCNVENGELAAQYANAADLIVFASHASSPGRRSDLLEIQSLLAKQKPLVVLLTGSDEVEQDENAAGEVISVLRMKPEAARREQVEYVQNELNSLDDSLRGHLADARVYPVSVRYAEAADAPARWDESGMGDFAARLGEIARSQGLAYKSKAPLRALATYCHKLDQSAQQLVHCLDGARRDLRRDRERIALRGERALLAIRRGLSGSIERLADTYAGNMDSAGFAEASRKACLQLVKDEITQLLGDMVADFDKLMDRVEHSVKPDTDLPGFSRRRETAHYHSSSGERYGKALGSGLGLLATVLAVATGPVGLGLAVAGGLAGGKLGGMLGKRFDGDETLLVDVGDNRDEVAVQTREALLAHAEKIMHEVIGQIDHLCFAQIDAWLDAIAVRLNALRAELGAQCPALEDKRS